MEAIRARAIPYWTWKHPRNAPIFRLIERASKQIQIVVYPTTPNPTTAISENGIYVDDEQPIRKLPIQRLAGLIISNKFQK